MSHPANLLIVLADAEHARFVRAGAGGVLHTERSFDAMTAHKQSSDLGSDHPGASYHGGASAHNAFAPKHDPHELAGEGFAKLVAAEVNALGTAGGFDALVLAAPAHSLNALRAALDAGAAAKLSGTLHKELLKTPDDELQPHLADFVAAPNPPRKT